MTGSPPAQDPHDRVPPFHPARLLLSIERTPAGSMVVTSPHLPGWQITCRGPVGLASAVELGWRENACRAYANSRGVPYDRTPTEPDLPDLPTYDDGWTVDEDGQWISPKGLHYPPTARVVGLVRARRERMTG